MTVKFKCRVRGCKKVIDYHYTCPPRCPIHGSKMVKAQREFKAPASGSKYNEYGGRNS